MTDSGLSAKNVFYFMHLEASSFKSPYVLYSLTRSPIPNQTSWDKLRCIDKFIFPRTFRDSQVLFLSLPA